MPLIDMLNLEHLLEIINEIEKDNLMLEMHYPLNANKVKLYEKKAMKYYKLVNKDQKQEKIQLMFYHQLKNKKKKQK